MAYSAEISRTNPTAFLFLIDQSGSMADAMPDLFGKKPKSHFLADALNKLLYNLTIRCAKSEGVRDYFWVGIIGFGSKVHLLLTGTTADKPLLPMSKIANAPLRIEKRAKKIDDGAGGIIEQEVSFPIWFDPQAAGETKLKTALGEAELVLKNWVQNHPNSFPPVVMILTDGEATDGDPQENLKKVASIATSDGNVVLFNVHISSNPAQPVSFPSADVELPDPFARGLFDTSSLLPPHMKAEAQEMGFARGNDPRCYVFNADSSMIVNALEIGTRPGPLR